MTLGGDVTEIVFALGEGHRVVGADRGSAHPPEVLDRPRLNYHRHIYPEGVLSLEPALVLLNDEAGPPTAIEQIRAAGVDVVMIPEALTADEISTKILAVARAIGEPEAGQRVIDRYERELADVMRHVASFDARPRVMFLYARQGIGAPLVGGEGSGAESMIALAGGTNAATGFKDYKPLTPEALVASQPEVILMMDKGYEAVGGDDGLLAIPGMEETPAGRHRNFITLPDDLLLSFGPRTPEAIRKLADAFHGEKGDEKP